MPDHLAAMDFFPFFTCGGCVAPCGAPFAIVGVPPRDIFAAIFYSDASTPSMLKKKQEEIMPFMHKILPVEIKLVIEKRRKL